MKHHPPTIRVDKAGPPAPRPVPVRAADVVEEGARATGAAATGAAATGAAATGAAATGAFAAGSAALGALAVGALAIGALAIGRLVVGQAKLGRVDIGRLTVERLEIGPRAGTVTAMARIRAAPGRGDAVADLLLDHARLFRATRVGMLLDEPQRSSSDPDLFLLRGSYPDATAFERYGRPSLDMLGRLLAEEGLTAGAATHAIAVELYQAVS